MAEMAVPQPSYPRWLRCSQLSQEGSPRGGRYGCGSASPAMSTRDGWKLAAAAIPHARPAGRALMAELATSQPSWVRWLGQSHFSHLLWLGHRDCSHPPEPWLVIIRWQPMAAVPRGRGRQARSHLCVWRGRRTAAIELSPAMLRRMAALTVPQPY